MAALVVGVLLASCTTPPTGPSPWPGGQWRPGPETYDVEVVKDVPFAMSDGVTLKGDIGYPVDRATGQRATGPFPVLLSQNPYGASFQPAPYFVSRGYIYVIVDVRGTTPRSPSPVTADGQFFGPRNAQDGVELVSAVSQGFAGGNGTVGLIGCSFLGITQIFTAAKLGPNSPVKAMVPSCASMGYETFFDGGVPGLIMDAFALAPEDNKLALDGRFAAELSAEVKAGGDAAYARDFWKKRDGVTAASKIVENDIPTLLWTGWQALEGQGAVDLYVALQNAVAGRDPYAAVAPGQPVSGKYQLVMGAGGHGAGLDPAFQLQWFERWLRGQDTGIDRTSTPFHVVEAGSNRWINTDRLPVAPTTPYYLGGTALTGQAPAAAGRANLRYAPPAQSGASVAFTSPAVTEAKSIAGPVTATIYASSSTTNAELIATLYDVGPFGGTTKIADGALIGSLRAVDDAKSWKEADGRVIKPHHPFTGDVPLTPGRVERFDIKLDTALYQVAAGHSLRLTLTTQSPAASCALTNVVGLLGPAIPCTATAPQKAGLDGSTYQIITGGADASLVNVPLVRPSDLKATLACATPTSAGVVEPMNWDGGVNGPRDSAADQAACRNA